jgi:CPA2 family monovalent cation:H+ antiporter-2
MPHETGLIATMSIALALAFAGSLLAVRLGLPALVGYLVSGIMVGPFTPGFVADPELAPQLAEIGVILLMFGVGTHFSIRDLLSVRRIAIPGAIGQIVAAMLATLAVTHWWGWSIEAGLVLGLAVSVASTVVLMRTLLERDLLATTQGKIAMGWLIVEDLVIVLTLILLPVLATGAESGDRNTADIALAIGMAAGQVVLLGGAMLIVGARVVPWLLQLAAQTESRELFTLAVLAVALGVAFTSAAVFGVSLALGAFLAGVVVGESEVGRRAADDALPLRDAFAVLFFVSVGMLFDPSLLVTQTWHVLAVVGLIVVAKPLAAFVLVRTLGYELRTGLTVAIGRAQVGELSFILGGAGRALGLLPDEGYGLILAGAILSITLNPLLFRGLDRLERWLPAPGLQESIAGA